VGFLSPQGGGSGFASPQGGTSGFGGAQGRGEARSTLLNGLVDFWRLEEVSGSRIGVRGNNLTDVNTVTQDASGRVGNAALFTAANSEELTSTSSLLLPGDSTFSMAGWAKFVDVSVNVGIVAAVEDATSDRAFVFSFEGAAAGGRWALNIRNGASSNELQHADAALVNDTWYFWYFSHDHIANELQFSRDDGALTTEATTTTLPATADIFRMGNEFYFMDGSIDAVGFWNRELTAAEITTLHNSGAGLEHPFAA